MKLFTTSDSSFWCSDEQFNTLTALQSIRNGGIASVNSYRPASGYVVSPVVNLRVITAFNMGKLYARRVAALQAVTFAQVQPLVTHPKLAALSNDALEVTFNKRKAFLIESLQKTQNGQRDDAHRVAHDRNYAHVAQGVKVNYVTEKVDGKEIPVLYQGVPTCQSIMFMVLEIGREVLVPGERKPVNSGPDVLIGNLIESLLPATLSVRAVSLKQDNFKSVSVSKLVIDKDDVANHEFDIFELLS